jgi:protein-S-isoprenylcysteine O-methyltransferase Ste14
MENEVIFRTLLLVLFVAFIAHRGYYTRRFGRSTGTTIREREETLVPKLVSLLSVPALIATVAFIIAPVWMSWAALPLPTGVRWAGVGTALLGFGLLQWAHQALDKNWSDLPRLTQEQTLVTSGPYRWIRHPIYTAFLLIMSATLLLSANWLIGVLWLGMTAAEVLSRIRTEEGMMTVHFGDRYRAYMCSTGRLLPGLMRLKGWTLSSSEE